MKELLRVFRVYPVVTQHEEALMIRTILALLVLLLIIGSVPTWPYSSGWGYYPSGGFTLLLIILVLWALATRKK